MSSKVYAYFTSQGLVLYVRDDGDLILNAYADESKLIQAGMEAVGFEVVELDDVTEEIERGITAEEISDMNDVTSEEIRKRIVARAEIEEDL